MTKRCNRVARRRVNVSTLSVTARSERPMLCATPVTVISFHRRVSKLGNAAAASMLLADELHNVCERVAACGSDVVNAGLAAR